MAHSGDKITGPDVKILADLQPVLGTSKTGLGDICKNAEINIWNRFKPFRNSAVTFATAGQMSGDRWNTAKAVKFGLDIKSYRGLSGLNSMITYAKSLGAGVCAWNYLRPRGSSEHEPFRIFDFIGYKHSLNPILSATVNPSKKYKIDRYQYLQILIEPQDVNCNISLADLGLGSYLHGIAYRKKSSSSVTDMHYATRSSTGGLDLSLALGTDYDAVFFFSPKALSGSTTVTDDDVFYIHPFPYIEIGAYDEWGLQFTGTQATYFGEKLSVSPRVRCLGGNRTVTKVRLCHRKRGNYGTNPDGTVWITETASRILADNEDDYEFRNMEPIEIPETPTGTINQYFPNPSLATMVSLDIDPYSGSTFIQFTTTHLNGDTLVEDDEYVFGFPYPLPVRPTL